MVAEPGEAWLELVDGERVVCLLEQIGPNRWQAVPVRDVDLDEVAQGFVDVVPPGGSVAFAIGAQA